MCALCSKGSSNEEIFEWFEEVVKSLPEVFSESNQNFVAIVQEGVVNMLHGMGCEHLSTLHSVAASSGTLVLESVPTEV
jgi:glutamate synthase domain-containing protein 2